MPDPTTYSLTFQGSVVNELLTKVSVASGSLLTTESNISGSKIQASSVGASQLATNAVASEHIQDGAVTGAKINNNAELTIVSLTATSSISVDSKPVATQEWTSQNFASRSSVYKLGSTTLQTIAAQSVTTDSNRTYAIQTNASNEMVVNVPWQAGESGSDIHVQQVATTSNKDYRVLLSNDATDSEETDVAHKTTSFKYNPSSSMLKIGSLTATGSIAASTASCTDLTVTNIATISTIKINGHKVFITGTTPSSSGLNTGDIWFDIS